MARRFLKSAFQFKNFRWLTFGLTFFLAFIPSHAQTSMDAWWLTESFKATETTYENLCAAQFDPNWVKFSFLKDEILPSQAKQDLSWMHRDGFKFQIDNAFKRKGIINRALCGVFEDKFRKKGRFIVVLEKTKSTPWKVSFLFEESIDVNFSVLRYLPKGLFWGTCMKCGDFLKLRFQKGKYFLDDYDPHDPAFK